MTKASHRRQGLFEAYGSRRTRVHHHHGGETWQQADMTVGAGTGSSHLEPQTGSRESALATSHGF